MRLSIAPHSAGFIFRTASSGVGTQRGLRVAMAIDYGATVQQRFTFYALNSYERLLIFFLHDCNDLLFNEFLAINDVNALGKSGKRIANLLATEVVDCCRSNGC